MSHIIIPRRDRLIRPDNPLDGLRIETDLRQKGLTIVFRGFVLAPVRWGQRINLAELMLGVFEYEESGKFRRQLAEKVLLALPGWPSRGCRSAGPRRTGSSAGWPPRTAPGSGSFPPASG